MNMFFAEPMRIAMQCTQAANRQCRMMMLFPWMLWMPQPRNADDQPTDAGR